MATGFRGTFVISWSQTEVDGLTAAPVEALAQGAAWCWRGEAVRVDGPTDVLRLDEAIDRRDMRRRAAGAVRKLVGTALERAPRPDDAAPPLDSHFTVTDGRRTYAVTLIEVGGGARPLLMFVDTLPPRDRDLWVVRLSLDPGAGAAAAKDDAGGVICFTPGTRILTPRGPQPVETLRAGDEVQTRDDGVQPIRWIASRRMTGARLFAMPHLRPVRLRAGALGKDIPDDGLLVSPQHRLLVRGDRARALFNADEVLVTARDLVDGDRIAVDLRLRQVTYIHLLLDAHQVIWANGVETESFHPASAALTALGEDDRARLETEWPGLVADPQAYGPFARRSLSASEAAILRHVA